MSERQQSPYDSIASRWLVLIERRQQNFIELYNTGRWRHYFTHAQFLDEMRKLLGLRNEWAQLAGLPVDRQQIDFPQTDLDRTGLQQNIKQAEKRNRNWDAQGTPEVDSVPPSAAGQRARRPSAILAAVAGRL
jgi:uncharacterized repeat protein (TIGR03809 family)